MRVDAEKNGARLASEHDDRITPVGKVIRACRIDELPQLIFYTLKILFIPESTQGIEDGAMDARKKTR